MRSKLLGAELERADVGGSHHDVGRRALLDERALRVRVRDRRDAAVREPRGGPQRERAPAAAEVEHVLAIDEPRAFGVELEHRGLGRAELGHAGRPVARRVLAMRAEHALEERGWNLVVLRVRGAGLDRDVGRTQRRDERVRIAPGFVVEPHPAHRANPRTQDRLGNHA